MRKASSSVVTQVPKKCPGRGEDNTSRSLVFDWIMIKFISGSTAKIFLKYTKFSK